MTRIDIYLPDGTHLTLRPDPDEPTTELSPVERATRTLLDADLPGPEIRIKEWDENLPEETDPLDLVVSVSDHCPSCGKDTHHESRDGVLTCLDCGNQRKLGTGEVPPVQEHKDQASSEKEPGRWQSMKGRLFGGI